MQFADAEEHGGEHEMIELPKVISSMVLVSLCVACSAQNRPGPEPAAVPPQLVLDTNNRLTWDRPEAFGPVPSALQSRGNNICYSASQTLAIGYHPKAMNRQGLHFEGGGYLCAR